VDLLHLSAWELLQFTLVFFSSREWATFSFKKLTLMSSTLESAKQLLKIFWSSLNWAQKLLHRCILLSTQFAHWCPLHRGSNNIPASCKFWRIVFSSENISKLVTEAFSRKNLRHSWISTFIWFKIFEYYSFFSEINRIS